MFWKSLETTIYTWVICFSHTLKCSIGPLSTTSTPLHSHIKMCTNRFANTNGFGFVRFNSFIGIFWLPWFSRIITLVFNTITHAVNTTFCAFKSHILYYFRFIRTTRKLCLCHCCVAANVKHLHAIHRSHVFHVGFFMFCQIMSQDQLAVFAFFFLVLRLAKKKKTKICLGVQGFTNAS